MSKTNIIFRVQVSWKERLKARAKEEGITVTELIRRSCDFRMNFPYVNEERRKEILEDLAQFNLIRK